MKQLLILIVAATALSAGADGDAARGLTLFETCRGCHSVPDYTNAFPNYPVPKIGGQHASRVAAALNAYKSGERGHPTMHAQAASLSDQDIQDLAAYLAPLGGTPTGAASKGTPPAKAAVCAACHGPDGNSPSPEFPILAGQYAGYLLQAMHQYHSGARSNPIMGPQAKALSEQEMRELATYFSAQPSPLRTLPLSTGK
jgi:cytochrome c553